MKRNLKRFLALLICALMLTSALGFTASGAAPSPVGEERRLTGHIPFRGLRSTAISDGKIAATASAQNRDPLPAYYNSNENGLVTRVKSQAYSDCWAHAALASCETFMIKNAVDVALEGLSAGTATTALDLAENHLCSFSFDKIVDPLDIADGEYVELVDYGPNDLGGNGYIATAALMSLNGPANEGTAALAYRADLDADYRVPAEYAFGYDAGHVTDVVVIPTGDREAMKRAILKYGAGSFGYCSAPNDSFTTYTNDETGASCFIQTAEYGSDGYFYPDHDVTVVGWDDNYSRTNFNRASRPREDGAWIIKNSWSTYYGDEGYFYISYEDTASSNDESFFYTVEKYDPDMKIYQYDNVIGFEQYWLPSGGSMASVFTAQSDELLDAVAVSVADEGIDYTLEIFVGGGLSDPESGELKITQHGNLGNAGYRRIDLDVPVEIAAGQRFAVVFTLDLADDDYLVVNVAESVDYPGWGMNINHGVYENTCYTRDGQDQPWEDDSSEFNYRIKAYTHPAPAAQERPGSWSVDNYDFTLDDARGVNFIRIAPGVLTTSAEIRNHPELISLDAATVASLTDENGALTYSFLRPGVYSIWIRYSDNEAFIISGVDVTKITPSVREVLGLTVSVDNLVLDDATGVKDIWIARGTLDTYSQCKDAANKIVQVTANKIALANNNYGRSYQYQIDYKAASADGNFTVCVRYNDNREPTILHLHIDYPQPEVIVNGLQSTVTDLDGIKCIRVAPGEWADAAAVKRAPGVRVFSGKTILKGLDEYTIQYNKNSADMPYTLSIEYQGGYTVVETIDAARLVPTVTVNADNTVTFGDLDQLYIIRYAPNPKNSIDWSQGYFKRADGNRYAKTANLAADGTFTTEVLPEAVYKDNKDGQYKTCNIWTFMVQYTEESYSIITVDFSTGEVGRLN